tara:strand:- start:217 stop:705 length:489 start_codon:yes stop_codon:yes gene_type:complete
MKKFDPFSYEHLFYEYEIKIEINEINQVLILLKDLNTGDQKTTYNRLNILNFPALKNLKKQVTDILDKNNLLLDNSWAQLYNSNNKHTIHNHYGSAYSGIIYINGLEPSPTVFYDSLFNPYYHNFKKNTLIMFPSMIPHQVENLKIDEQRLVISFNTKKNIK